jgi:hypothetical protein
MSKQRGLVLFVALAAAFLVANRGAYQGYFQDDEISTLSWIGYGSLVDYLKGALTPLFQVSNFRPTGFFYFHEAERFFGLDFPKYVAVIHLFHLLNVWLVWTLSRRLGASLLAAGAGAVLFAFHMALFDAVWKPMYVFDVLCGTFCLVSVLLYLHQRWVLSFVSFWLAYKAKELAVMLPLVLACYEIWIGERRWKPLVPFFAASLSFGLQGLLLNPNQVDEYSFRFTPAALARTSVFYARFVFLVPYLGFVLPLALLVNRNRRMYFGLAMMGLFFFPLLFLPGRLVAAYCYVPFTGLAIAFAGIAESLRPVWVEVFFLACLPQDVHWLRVERRATLAGDNEVREWVGTLVAFAKTNPPVDDFVAIGAPASFASWGVEGAVKYVFHRLDVKVSYSGDLEGAKMLAGEKVAVLRWDGVRHKLEITQGRGMPGLPH